MVKCAEYHCGDLKAPAEYMRAPIDKRTKNPVLRLIELVSLVAI
jgi:hypothetical protein